MTVKLTVDQRNVLLSLVSAARDECALTAARAMPSGTAWDSKLADHNMRLVKVYVGIYDALQGGIEA